MSYTLSLDEYDEELLVAELEKRKLARSKGLCDYCNRPQSTYPCKYPNRHIQTIDFIKITLGDSND